MSKTPQNAALPETVDALVVGAGPAGLMAAQRLSEAGLQVVITEHMPSPARKLLMAGKSGLNITKDEPFEDFLNHYEEAAPTLKPILQAFDSDAVQCWARSMGQELFTGSSGRVFPVGMKASPLLRSWLANLNDAGARLHRKWRLIAIEKDTAGNTATLFEFDTPKGKKTLVPKVTVLAMGGGSWSRLGSDGHWSNYLQALGITTVPFAPANASLMVDWSTHMEAYFGQPIKSTELHASGRRSRGEFVVSRTGLEGSGIYSVSKSLRDGSVLSMDLFPDIPLATLQKKLNKPRGKASVSKYLKQRTGLIGARMALFREFCTPANESIELAKQLKHVPIGYTRLSSLDGAISTAGGVSFQSLDERLMLTSLPGVFCAGEMLDWEAPTGGYLLTACLATGSWAGNAAVNFNK